ncbi:MAG: 5'-methylthioadenosine/adenosylhomocysteine nucleosidase [Lachnospiraceae bacterium]|nr:5'-methylthioadenosine/adenosylhomocysteine nucleosidase [Lachnospiraceae bacterium]
MRLGIIGAMQIEIENLKKHMTNVKNEEVSGVTFTIGEVEGVEVVAAVSGIGKVFAAICTEAMILKYDVDQVINIGVAGTLCDELGVMDVAIANQVVQHDMNTSALGDPVGLLSGINEVYLPADKGMCKKVASVAKEMGINYLVGTIATGDLFLTKESMKEDIHKNFGAIAGEMEGGSVGQVCFVNKVPFTIIRSISDGKGAAMDYATFAEKAAQVGIDIVVEYIKGM